MYIHIYILNIYILHIYILHIYIHTSIQCVHLLFKNHIYVIHPTYIHTYIHTYQSFLSLYSMILYV